MAFRSYIETVEAKGWCLYDVTGELQLETWEERGERQPATQVEEGSMYLFVPQPSDGQTLREAYAVTKGLGPCLRIGDVDSPVYKSLALCMSPRLAFFTRFLMKNSEVHLFTPSAPYLPISDLVVLVSGTAEETFARDFDVIDEETFKKELAYTDAEWR